MDKQNRIHTYNGLLFHLEKEENPDTCYNIEEPEDNVLSEISKSQKDKYCVIPLV